MAQTSDKDGIETGLRGLAGVWTVWNTTPGQAHTVGLA